MARTPDTCADRRQSAPAGRWLTLIVTMLCACTTVADAQARIVSTSPSITETLFALGLGDRVVGVSRFCRYPVEALALPKIGTFVKPDLELIARLRPDLVVVHRGSSGIQERLAALRIRSVTVERGTLANVFSSMRVIGTAAGVPGAAEELIATLQARLARVRTSVAQQPRRRVLIIVGRQPGRLTGLVAAGPHSYLNDLLQIAGGTNVLAQSQVPEYPMISLETVVRLAPDLIVDASEVEQSADDGARRRPATERLWRQTALAAHVARVRVATSEAFTVPGPRVVEAAEMLAAWLDEGEER